MPQHIAVIGAGTIGASWAALFLAFGHDVAVSDPSPQGEAFARRFIDNAWPTLETLGLVRPGASPTRFRFCKDPATAADGAAFVQESGPEREDLKIDLFATLDAAAPPDTVIASSSSGLLISRVIANFNPPHLIPLVEIVGGDKTAPQAIDRAMAFYRSVGKHPIHIKKEVRGHVANRLQAALWREAIHLVAEGVVSVADADAAVAYGPGLRWALMGPHLTFHLAGGEGGMAHFMSHIGPAVQNWMDDLGTPQLTPEVQQTIVEGVADEAGARSVADLQKWRDRKLIDILRATAGS